MATGAAPLLVPASSLGYDRPAPSDRIHAGFIGVGWKGLEGCWGSLVQGFTANPLCRSLAVCDINSQKCQKAKQTIDESYGNTDCRVYRDFRELLACDDIDAVVIGTPDHWHAIQTIEACRAGKDVYCEKPLSLTIREARAMVNAARQYGRVVQTGSQSRSFSNIEFACRAAAQRDHWPDSRDPCDLRRAEHPVQLARTSPCRITSTGTCGWDPPRGDRITRRWSTRTSARFKTIPEAA